MKTKYTHEHPLVHACRTTLSRLDETRLDLDLPRCRGLVVAFFASIHALHPSSTEVFFEVADERFERIDDRTQVVVCPVAFVSVDGQSYDLALDAMAFSKEVHHG